MNQPTIASVCVPLFLTAFAQAQVAPGNIGITGFSASAFSIADPTVTAYATPGFGGTGTSQSILHDPTTFIDFLVGGFGFVGRATITSPGAVSYSVITTGIGTACQMSWDNSGNIIVADAGTDQVRSVTPGGVVTDLSIGAQPWGSTVNAGAYDPATGDVIVGNNGGIYRLANGSTTGVAIVTGLGTPNAYISNIQFDPYNGDIIATVLNVNRLIRVDSAGTVTDLIPPGSITTMNALQFDSLGNYLVGRSGGEVLSIDYAGNSSLVAVNASPPGGTVSGLAYVQTGCDVALFGTPCNGPAGPTYMTASGNCSIGGTITTTSINHGTPALGLAVYGLTELTPPLDLGLILGANGCLLYPSPDVLVGGLTNASGEFSSSITSNATFVGQTLYVQHAVLEGPLLSDFSSSNAARINY